MTTVTTVSHGEDEAFWDKRKKYSKKHLKFWSIFNIVNGIFAIVLQVCLNYTVKISIFFQIFSISYKNNSPKSFQYSDQIYKDCYRKLYIFKYRSMYISILYKSHPLYMKFFSWKVNRQM